MAASAAMRWAYFFPGLTRTACRPCAAVFVLAETGTGGRGEWEVTGHQDHQAAGPRLLGIYLNDHLAGATAGTELARRAAVSRGGTPVGATLARLAREVTQDRAALVEMMTALGVTVRQYKAGLAWLSEKAARLKPNGRIGAHSPLSLLEEVELMRLGVEGKAAGWRTLRKLAERDQRLDLRQLDELIERARSQSETLEELRVNTAEGLVQLELTAPGR